ncbi:hypothetical protein FOA52_014458 [Chlamydomonas sp. UWO 241]|nr:hypothetical protein FOA52_014458 [Chlamydomonas sp. UWO 241]
MGPLLALALALVLCPPAQLVGASATREAHELGEVDDFPAWEAKAFAAWDMGAAWRVEALTNNNGEEPMQPIPQSPPVVPEQQAEYLHAALFRFSPRGTRWLHTARAALEAGLAAPAPGLQAAEVALASPVMAVLLARISGSSSSGSGRHGGGGSAEGVVLSASDVLLAQDAVRDAQAAAWKEVEGEEQPKLVFYSNKTKEGGERRALAATADDNVHDDGGDDGAADGDGDGDDLFGQAMNMDSKEGRTLAAAATAPAREAAAAAAAAAAGGAARLDVIVGRTLAAAATATAAALAAAAAAAGQTPRERVVAQAQALASEQVASPEAAEAAQAAARAAGGAAGGAVAAAGVGAGESEAEPAQLSEAERAERDAEGRAREVRRTEERAKRRKKDKDALYEWRKKHLKEEDGKIEDWRTYVDASTRTVAEDQTALRTRLVSDLSAAASHLSTLLASTPSTPASTPPPSSLPMARRALVLRLLEFLHDMGYSLEGSPPGELLRHLGDDGMVQVHRTFEALAELHARGVGARVGVSVIRVAKATGSALCQLSRANGCATGEGEGCSCDSSGSSNDGGGIQPPSMSCAERAAAMRGEGPSKQRLQLCADESTPAPVPATAATASGTAATTAATPAAVLCAEFVHVMPMRHPLPRARAHLAVLVEQVLHPQPGSPSTMECGTEGKADCGSMLENLSTNGWVGAFGPQISNLYVRSLLGGSAHHALVHAINASHTAAAAALLTSVDVLPRLLRATPVGSRPRLLHPHHDFTAASYNCCTLWGAADGTRHDPMAQPTLLARYLGAHNIDICGLQEVRHHGSGCHTLENGYHFIWSGGTAHTNGVGALLSPDTAMLLRASDAGFAAINDRILVLRFHPNGAIPMTAIVAYAPTEAADDWTAKDAFYEQLHDALTHTPAHHYILVMGDFNATTTAASSTTHPSVGRHACPTSHSPSSPFPPNSSLAAFRHKPSINDNGHRLLDLCSAHSLSITHSFFPNPPARAYTWYSRNRKDCNILDYILVRSSHLSSVHDPSRDEIEAAIKALKNTSPGSDAITAPLIKSGGPAVASALHDIIRSCWDTNTTPIS